MKLTSAITAVGPQLTILQTSIVKSLFNSEFHQAQEVDFSKLPFFSSRTTVLLIHF